MTKKKLIFKNGVQTIHFPAFLPIGDFQFQYFCRYAIETTKNRFYPRKNVKWDCEIVYSLGHADVIVTKIK